MSDLSDILSAQSLLLAVNAALYSLWSAEMEAASKVQYVGQDQVSNQTLGAKVRTQLWARAVPLLAYSVALTLILVPISITVLASIIGHEPRIEYEFDALGATLVLVHVGFLMFTIHLAFRTAALGRKRAEYRKLTPPPVPPAPAA